MSDKISAKATPAAIKMAVKQALVSLGINNVEPQLGDYIKAKLSDDDVDKIRKVCGGKIEEATTASGDTAIRIKLDSTWELKI